MEGISGIRGVAGAHTVDLTSHSGTGGAGIKFKGVMDAISGIQGGAGTSFHEIQALQQKVLNSNQLSPRDLLIYQIKVSQFGLHTELISKVAESASATMKKLQNGQ